MIAFARVPTTSTATTPESGAQKARKTPPTGLSELLAAADTELAKRRAADPAAFLEQLRQVDGE
jgi:hypothetical protein